MYLICTTCSQYVLIYQQCSAEAQHSTVQFTTLITATSSAPTTSPASQATDSRRLTRADYASKLEFNCAPFLVVYLPFKYNTNFGVVTDLFIDSTKQQQSFSKEKNKIIWHISKNNNFVVGLTKNTCLTSQCEANNNAQQF